MSTAATHSFRTQNSQKHTGLLTYLPLRNSLLSASLIISKATEAAFYGDPCFSGQFRGALFIALQPARNAPQQRRTPCLVEAEAVWAISAGRGALAVLFDNSGGGFVNTIDSGRAQSSAPRSRGSRRMDLSRSSNLKSRRAGVSTPAGKGSEQEHLPDTPPDSGKCGGGSVSEELVDHLSWYFRKKNKQNNDENLMRSKRMCFLLLLKL